MESTSSHERRRPRARSHARTSRPAHTARSAHKPRTAGTAQSGVRSRSASRGADRSATRTRASRPASAARTGGRGRGIRFIRSDEPRKRARAQARPRRATTSPTLVQRTAPESRTSLIHPVTDPDIIRVVAVSGAEEVGRNMYFYEDKDNIIVIDCGLQFVAPTHNAPGVNYILPNTQYLEKNKHKIRGVFITHAHLDHIGGLPFIMERLGYPPLYTQYLTSLMVLRRQEEFPHLEKLNIQVIKEGEGITFDSGLKVKTFPVTHSIPDAMGVAIETKWGNVIYTGDVRLETKDGEVFGKEKESWEKVGAENNLLMLADSTNAHYPGFSQPESVVFENLRKYIRDTKGRLIVGTFASQFERLIAIVKACEEYGRVVVPEGRSLKTNIDIALKSGILKVPAGLIISAAEAEKYPRDKVVVLATGAQGEEFAALSRMAGGTHKFFKLDQYDTLVLSSSVIPGNELAVQLLKDKIFRNNVHVITHREDQVHSSGHGYAGELSWIRHAVNPKFLMPVHGHHFMLKSHMFAAIQDGFPRDNIVVPDNGSVVEIYKGEMLRVLPEKMPIEQLTVDGRSVGIRQEVVLRDRVALSTDGMFVVVASLNMRTGKLRKSPDIISRGFVYLRENQQLLNEARTMVRSQIEGSTGQSRRIDLDVLRDEVTEALTKFLLQRTDKTPIVIPVIIGF